MQRFMYLYSNTSRLIQIVGVNSLRNSNQFVFQTNRYLATNKTNDINTHPELYKPSTAKEEQHIPGDLRGGQSPETVETNAQNLSNTSGKVWSANNPDGIHVGSGKSTKFVPTSTEGGIGAHETTVHTSKRDLNIADPFGTRKFQPEVTSGQLAEAAAASAFEPFAPDTPLTKNETVFAPKIASTQVYSNAASPTSNFDSPVSSVGSASTTSSSSSSSEPQETIKYETARKGKVYGGQNTSADTKKHPQENPFNLHETIDPSNDIYNEILRKSLKYVHEKGWSMDAIRAGINACKQPTTSEALFSNCYDLVEYFMRDANAKMVNYMNELAKKENMQGTRLLIEGLKYHLKLVISYADIWEEALAQKGLPSNAKRAWKCLLDLADDAWINIGDTSTDIKWYTKRLSVAAIYRSAEIYMLRDQSPDKIESLNFLERHLGDFQTTGIVRSSVSQSLSDTAQVASGLFDVVCTMATRR